MFNIEMLPAGHGDSLLLSYGEPANPRYILIDGGPFYVFSNARDKKRVTLRSRIKQLLKDRQRIELLVITHVDADHIEAPLRLLADMPPNLEIGRLWFNDLSHLKGGAPGGFLGPEQGEMLSALVQTKLLLPWNTSFGGRAVAWYPTGSPPTITLSDGFQLTVLSPTPEKIRDLIPEWEKAWADATKASAVSGDADERLKLALRLLQESRLAPKESDGWLGDPVELYGDEPFEEDLTAANGSSIALLAEYEGKSCILAGDAHPSVLVSSLRRLLRDRNMPDVMTVDAFKLPHHGSKNNLSPELSRLVRTRNYLLSSNGSHYSHPHPQTIARLIRTNEAGWDEIDFRFNYCSKQTQIWGDDDFRRRYRYQTHYPQVANQSLIVEL
jgi:beta-lactamase superfamily II metal-dependent hydrolase